MVLESTLGNVTRGSEVINQKSNVTATVKEAVGLLDPSWFWWHLSKILLLLLCWFSCQINWIFWKNKVRCFFVKPCYYHDYYCRTFQQWKKILKIRLLPRFTRHSFPAFSFWTMKALFKVLKWWFGEALASSLLFFWKRDCDQEVTNCKARV